MARIRIDKFPSLQNIIVLILFVFGSFLYIKSVVNSGKPGVINLSNTGIIIEFIPGGSSSGPSGEDLVDEGEFLVTWDEEKTSNIVNIDWGTLSPGASGTKTVYISNESKYPSDLSITTENWNPPVAKEFINMTWANYKDSSKDLTDMPLGGNTQEGLVLKMAISPSVTGINNYSFDIRILITTK